MNHADFEDYKDDLLYFHYPVDFHETAEMILKIFRSEKYYETDSVGEQNAFANWCQGLPSALDTCYYYNRSAIEDLGNILEESDSEKSRYTEEQAGDMLTKLLYRELIRG